MGIREILGTCQTVLPKGIFMDATRSGAHIFQTPREVSRTVRDGSNPRDVNTSIATDRLTPPSLIFKSTSNFPTQTGNQDIFSPRWSVIVHEARNAEPLHAPINRFLAIHGHPTLILSRLIGPKTVSIEIANVYAHKRMDLVSNSIFTESPNFMDLGLSPANKTDKLKSVIGPTNKVEGLTDISGWLTSIYFCK